MELSRIDLRFALRALARDRIFLISIVLTLALGIGAIAGVFAVLETALLRPLPYPQPEGLVRLFVVDLLTNRDRNPSLEELFGLQGNTQSFQAMAAFGGKNLALIEADRTQSIRAMTVTPEFFALLGVKALRGRTLQEKDFLDGANSAVISYDLWQRSFGGDDSVIGSSVPVRVLGARERGEGDFLESLIIVGVLLPAFAMDRWPDPSSRFFNNQFTGKQRRFELWLPMNLRPESLPSGRLPVIARLSDHSSLEQAEADSNLALQHLQSRNNAQARGEVGLIRLRDSLVGQEGRRLFQTFLLAAGSVLLACCLNAANLFIAHIARNQDQYAILVALGASRSRMSRILVAQGLTVSSLAGWLGILLSAVFLLGLKSFAVPAIPRLEEVGLHARSGSSWPLLRRASACCAAWFCSGFCPSGDSTKR